LAIAVAIIQDAVQIVVGTVDGHGEDVRVTVPSVGPDRMELAAPGRRSGVVAQEAVVGRAVNAVRDADVGTEADTAVRRGGEICAEEEVVRIFAAIEKRHLHAPIRIDVNPRKN
jgi:hypothetical protein